MIYRVSDAETVLLAGTTGAEFRWRWPRTGIVTGYWLGTIDQALAGRAGLGLRMRIDNKEYATDPDNGASFVDSLCESGGDAMRGAWADVLFDVEVFDEWRLQLRNKGAGSVTPRLIFRFFDTGEDEVTA